MTDDKKARKAAYAREYRKANKEKIKEYYKNRDQLIKENKLIYDREYNKKYREENKEKIKIKGRNYAIKNKEVLKEKRKLVKKDKQKEKGRHLKRQYNISLGDYNELLNIQNNKCAICLVDNKDLNKSLSVDHCHKTGKIRGLLCHSCNSALGLFKDNVDFVFTAFEYLKRTRSESNT